jgi:hypothetical protein
VRDGEPVPRFGDDDEGFALRLDLEPVPDVHRHLGAVAAVTGDPVARRHGVHGLTAAWFADDGGPGTEQSLAPAQRYFPDSGLVVLRSRGRRVTMDVGPLGYLSIAAHGHADALAVGLAETGADLVGDPGAGSYYGHPRWRAAHRGTRMHPTVTVDGADQSVAGGPFLWTRRATTTVHGVDLAACVVDAEHDGYTRLARPVRHRRWLAAGPDDPGVVVVDLLSGEGAHEVVTSWPLPPDLEIRAPGPTGDLGRLVVTRDGATVLHVLQAVGCPSGARRPEPVSVRGDEETDLGWWSDRLEARRPAWLVGSRVRGELPIVVATVLHRPADGPEPSGLAVGLDAGTIRVSWRTTDGPEAGLRGMTVDPARSAAVDRSGSS